MKTKLNLPGASLTLALLLTSSTAFAQGSLTPPGAPAPTMVTLSQVQPRTPISSAPFTITQPGSYYLTTNVNVTSGNAITIATNGVALDLSGFTISSTAAGANGYGILLNSGLQNITIANGFIQGGVTNNGSGVYSGNGFTYGISFSGNSPANVLVSHVSVSDCLYYGIYLYIGDSTVVESCTARTIGTTGIFATTVKQSSARDCGNSGIIGHNASDCQGQTSGGGFGIAADSTLNCYGTGTNSGDGIYATTAENCTGYTSNGGYGVYATTALNCFGYSTSGGGYGVEATTAQNCYGYCNGNSGYGIQANALENCYGYNLGNGYGVYAVFIANGCIGFSSTGTGLFAPTASLCHGSTTSGTTLSTSHNINSF